MSDQRLGEVLADAIQSRKRYLPGDAGSALGDADIQRYVKARLTKPTPAQIDEQHVTEGVLGISNPGLYKKGLRWKDAFTCDKTSVYYTWDKPTSSSVWPQVAVTFINYGGERNESDAIATSVQNTPSRNNVTQLSNFLFLTTLRRTIRENKNPNGYYAMYQWYSTEGSVDFKIAGSANLNSSYSQVIPGGAVFAPPGGGSSSYTAMMTLAGGFMTNVVADANAASFRIPASSCSAIHGQFLPGMTYQGRTYIWCDGFSGTGGYTPSPIINVGGQQTASTAGLVSGSGTWADSTDNAPTDGAGTSTPFSSDIAAVGDLQLGGLYVLYGSNPLPPGQHFEVNIWRYNTKQPVLYATRAGAGGTTTATNQVMFCCNITQPDYYCVEIMISGNPSLPSQSGAPSGPTSAAGQGIFNFRILQINTGEMWAHTMTPNLCTLQNFGSIVASRCFGTSILATNTTPSQYLAGTFTGAQPPPTTEWQAVVNGITAPDPYSYIIQTLGERDMNLKNGAYGFVRPTEVSQMKLQSSIIANQNAGANIGYIFSEPLDNQPFYTLVLSSPGGVYVQTIQFSFDHNGEFVTRNQVMDVEASRFTPAQWMMVMEVLTSMEQTFENNNHNAETVLASLGKKVQLADQIGETILKWAPHVLKAGSLAWQYALPLLSAAAV
jgi:hypothetical protein